jgi:hypothetical protein
MRPSTCRTCPCSTSPNFQVLLEVTLSKDGDDQADQYRRDRHSSGERIYTLVPEEFHLSELVSAAFPDPPRRDSFSGTVVRGHFERRGHPVIDDVAVKVTNVVYFEQLDPRAARDETASLTYLCFGKPGDLFAAHMITARPDFDQILAVSLPDPDAAEMGFENAVPVEFGRNDSDALRLTEGEEADGAFTRSIGPQGQHGFRTKVLANAELYLEVGELK